MSPVSDTVSILRGLKERYEIHHGVRIRDAALVAAATYHIVISAFFPGQGNDLVDEAAALHGCRSILYRWN